MTKTRKIDMFVLDNGSNAVNGSFTETIYAVCIEKLNSNPSNPVRSLLWEKL